MRDGSGTYNVHVGFHVTLIHYNFVNFLDIVVHRIGKPHTYFVGTKDTPAISKNEWYKNDVMMDNYFSSQLK